MAVNIFDELHSATTEGIVADDSQIRHGSNSTVSAELENKIENPSGGSDGQVLALDGTTTVWKTLKEKTASDIKYTNEDSGLDADNAQDAIDVLKSNIDSVKTLSDESKNYCKGVEESLAKSAVGQTDAQVAINTAKLTQTPSSSSIKEGYELVLCDINGFAVLAIKNGHLCSKYFNSKNTSKISLSDDENTTISDDLIVYGKISASDIELDSNSLKNIIAIVQKNKSNIEQIENATAILQERSYNIPSNTEESGFFLTDENGYVALKYNKAEGFDAAKVSEHFLYLIKKEINTTSVFEVKETGFFIVDENYNIGVKFGQTSNTVPNIDYDNSTSGLSSDNIKDAIDELATKGVDTNDLDRTLFTNKKSPISTIQYSCGLCPIIRSWGFVGDSLCSGEVEWYTNNGSTRHWEDMYEYSWGEHICRLCGSTGYEYSFGGQTTAGWITTSNRGWSLAKTDPKVGYIVALGANDSGGGSVSDIGEYDADTDSDTCGSSFVGRYAAILLRLRSISDGPIFCVTQPINSNWYSATKNSNIRSVVNFLKDNKNFTKLYLIDLEIYSPNYLDSDFRRLYFQSSHLSAAGYLYTAYMFMNYIDYIIRNNPDDFSDIQLWNRTDK